MYAADFLQNHIRHFYLFSLPDFVVMPNKAPFLNQNLKDERLNTQDNQRLVNNYFEAIKASQNSHEILVLFGGKAPHQHSFVHGGVAVAPSVDKIGSNPEPFTFFWFVQIWQQKRIINLEKRGIKRQ